MLVTVGAPPERFTTYTLPTASVIYPKAPSGEIAIEVRLLKS